MRIARVQGRHGRRLGISLMVSSLAIGVFGPVSAIAIDELPSERVAVEEVTRMAYWNGDLSETVPTAVTKQFPPEAVCIVAPNVCSFPTGDDDPSSALPTGPVADAIGQLSDALSDATGNGDEEGGESGATEGGGVGLVGNALIDAINAQYKNTINNVQSNDPGLPAEPVADGQLPVSVAFGQAYYRSAFEFPLPEIPAGDTVDSFIVVLEQGQPTFATSSPLLRQAVLATLTCASETDSGGPTGEGGRCQREEFEKVATKELQDGEPLPFSMCPIAPDPLSGADNVEWSSGESPYDEDTLPSTDCLAGGRAEQFTDGDATVWAFDMTFALQNWASGTTPYNGMLIVPGAAENFAFGDAETTYSKQVTLQAATVSYAVQTSPAPPPPAPFEPFTPSQPTTTTTSTFSQPSQDLFGTPPTPTTNSPVAVPQPAVPAVTSEQPAVADGAQAPAVGQPTDVVAQPAATPSGSAWYVWLLVPIFLAGAYLLSRSLEEQAVLATARSGGAMTRLLERQAAQRAPDLVGH